MVPRFSGRSDTASCPSFLRSTHRQSLLVEGGSYLHHHGTATYPRFPSPVWPLNLSLSLLALLALRPRATLCSCQLCAIATQHGFLSSGQRFSGWLRCAARLSHSSRLALHSFL